MIISKIKKNTTAIRKNEKANNKTVQAVISSPDSKGMGVIGFYRKEFVELYLENQRLRKYAQQMEKENEILKKGISGDAESIMEMADCYFYGKDVAQNAETAVALYTRAANMCNTDAMCKVADCYECGIGVEKDRNKALNWYIKAAEQWMNFAMYKAGMVYAFEENFEKALYWLKMAEENGYTDARSWIEILNGN